MLAYISAEGINLFLHGVNAPVWRALATPGNSLLINAAAAVVTALALGYALGRYVQVARGKRLPSVGWRVATAFFCVPPFVRHITGLSPAMVSFVPIALALAALMLPYAGEVQMGSDEADRELETIKSMISGKPAYRRTHAFLKGARKRLAERRAQDKAGKEICYNFK